MPSANHAIRNQRSQTVSSVATTMVGGSIRRAGLQGFTNSWKDRSHAVTGAEGSCQEMPT